MKKTGKIILNVLVVILIVAFLVGEGVRIYNKKQLRENAEIRSEFRKWKQQHELEKEKQRVAKEEKHATDSKYQVKDTYNQLKAHPKMSRAKRRQYIDKLGQWIPVYRAELEDAREKAMEDGDASKIEHCDKELLWLETIEAELNL